MDSGSVGDIVQNLDFSDVEVSSVHTSDLSSDGDESDDDIGAADPVDPGFTEALHDVNTLPFREYVGVIGSHFFV